MRQTISGPIAAIAMMAVSAVPASACGGLFDGGCSPCGYVSPCAETYVQTYSGCVIGCGAAYERLPNPEVQYHSAPAALPRYYYVDQGPTYSGPGDFAPYPRYREGGYGRGYGHARRYFHRWHRHGYRPVLHSYY